MEMSPPTCVDGRGGAVHGRDVPDGTGDWWRSDDCVKSYAEYSAHCVAAAVKESSGMASRLATALRQAGDIKLERSSIELEGLSDRVSHCYVGLRGYGVRLPEVGNHIEASGLADAARDDPHGTGLRLHVYADVATELARRAKEAFRPALPSPSSAGPQSKEGPPGLAR